MICHQQDIDQIYLYVQDSYEANINQLLINNQKSTSLKHLNYSKLSLNTGMIQMIFIKILKNTIQIRNAKDWSEILGNKKRNPAVIELFTKGRKLNISLASIMKSYFARPKIIWLNSTHNFILKIPNKQELQQITLIILQILILEALWIFTKNILQKYILLWWCYSCIW